jgi:hypothetical protein
MDSMYVYDFGPGRCGSLCSFSRVSLKACQRQRLRITSGLLLLLVLVALSLHLELGDLRVSIW